MTHCIFQLSQRAGPDLCTWDNQKSDFLPFFSFFKMILRHNPACASDLVQVLRHCNSISGLSRPLPHPYCSPCYSAAALSGLQVHKITVFATTPASHPPFLQTTAKFTSLKNVILCDSYHICLRDHKSAIKPSIDQLPDPEHEHHSGSILNVRTEVDFRP